MTDIESGVAAHYGIGGVYDRILAALAAEGRGPDEIESADLKAVDEYHIGGVAATDALLDQARPGPGDRVLDIGCGIGGPARHIAEATGASVHGVDLTPEYVETARRLSELVGVAATFEVGSALDLPVDDASFDLATLIHVGMNIADKPRLFAEAARALRPGGAFLVYEVMRTGEEDIDYPVPWARTPETSFLGAPEDYLAAAEAAGLTVTAARNRRDVALEFFARQVARLRETGGRGLGPPLLMGADAPAMVGNMARNVEAGRIAPVEIICRKPG